MIAGVLTIAANARLEVDDIPRKNSLEESERLSLSAVLIRVLIVVKSLKLRFSSSRRECLDQIENSLVSLAPGVQHGGLCRI